MSLVPYSQLKLSRARKEMSQALDNGDWSSVGELDHQLGASLDHAVSDGQRDTAALLNEMGQLLALYKQLMGACDQQAKAAAPKKG